MSAVIELLKSHRSIRKFTSAKIDPQLLRDIVIAGQSAATSSFLQGATVIRVKDKSRREQLAHLAGDQKYVASAAEFLVFCADLKRAGNYCKEYGKPFAGDYTEHFIIATVDVALMAQSLVTAAESVGLGICYIGGIRNNPKQVSELLELPPHLETGPTRVVQQGGAVEIVQSGPAQSTVGKVESGRADDMGRYAETGGKPQNGAAVLWDVRLKECDFDHVLNPLEGRLMRQAGSDCDSHR